MDAAEGSDRSSLPGSERLGPALTPVRMAHLLAERLEALDMTQAEFARRSGASTKHINQVLNGVATAQAGTLDYWAYILGCRWDVQLVERSEEDR